jgi:hypothetical protein
VREEIGWSTVLTERRQWRTAAARQGRVRARERTRRSFYRPGASQATLPEHRAYKNRGMGAKAVDDVRRGSGQWRMAGKAGRVFIGRATPRGSFSRASLATVATAWRGGGWRRAAGRRPMAEGGTRAGVCAAAAWHRPRGGQRVTPCRHTVLAEPGLRPAVAGPLWRARPAVR